MTDSATTSGPEPRGQRVRNLLMRYIGEGDGPTLIEAGFDIIVDPLERQYPKIGVAMLYALGSLVLIFGMSSFGYNWPGVLIFLPTFFFLIYFLLKPKLPVGAGIIGAIAALLGDRDVSRGALQGGTIYLGFFRRALWVYVFLGFVPIVWSFEHAPWAYLAYVMVVILWWTAYEKVASWFVRWIVVPGVAAVVLSTAFWASLPPYVKGIYFENGAPIYMMEKDGSEIHHDRLVEDCNKGWVDCNSPYTGEDLIPVTPTAAEEHGFRPLTVKQVKELWTGFSSFDWLPKSGGEGNNEEKKTDDERHGAVEHPTRQYTRDFGVLLAGEKTSGWIRPGQKSVARIDGTGCIQIITEEAMMTDKIPPVIHFKLPVSAPADEWVTVKANPIGAEYRNEDGELRTCG